MIKQPLLWLIFVALQLVTCPILAEEVRDSSVRQQAKAMPAQNTMQLRKIQEQMQKYQEQVQKQLDASMETLKTTNPKMYQQLKAQNAAQQEISRIISAYRQKKLSASETEKRLYPLVKAQLGDQLATIDQQIALAKKQLIELEAMKRDPDLAVKKQINYLLGRGSPNAFMMGMGFKPWLGEAKKEKQ